MDYVSGPGRNHLFVPGPTNIAEPVIRAMMRNNEDHRSPAFPTLSRSCIQDVKQLFGCTNGVSFIFPATGTGGWESALTNTLSPGDKVISFRLGQFSLLWVDMMERLGFDVEVQDLEWGCGIDLAALEARLRRDVRHEIKAVCAVHNETSTGVTNDLAAIRAVLDRTSHPALFLVDGVSSVGAIPFRFDDWRVDVALTGSQKALSMPTGMAIVCASPKALEAAKTARSTRVFFNWADYLKFYETGSIWPYTPSIQMLYGLRAALDLMFAEGLENVYERHHRLAEATRAAVSAWGLQTCTKRPEWKSDTVTAVVVPAGYDSGLVVRHAWNKYNLSLGGGLNAVKGKVFRIGHLGTLNELQLMAALAGVEMVLLDLGYPIKAGSGVAAAEEYLRQYTPGIKSRTKL